MAANKPETWPAGLVLEYDVLSRTEEAATIGFIEASSLEYPSYDPGNSRSSSSFGWKYDFSTDSFRKCPEIPPEMTPLCERAAGMIGVAASDIAECLFNRYDPGAVIQPHFDKDVWEHVVGVSLGSVATMRFVRPSEAGGGQCDIRLPPRSMYVLKGDARYEWMHSLLPVTDTRWSITLRTLSELGKAQKSEQLVA
ncbi:MAG: alpha-ketoglutarate-dependent dioxygenase AlkB [Novosphingobium sp.]|nr:alpha-ketoglutarate-dependent dioxygenase AlkB [Novosphingobium sp.]